MQNIDYDLLLKAIDLYKLKKYVYVELPESIKDRTGLFMSCTSTNNSLTLDLFSNSTSWFTLLSDARDIMHSLCKRFIDYKDVDGGMNLVVQDTCVGSYGIKQYNNQNIYCGTGLLLPTFQRVIINE